MSRVLRLLLLVSAAALVAVLPASAQIYDQFTFTTTFPFQVGRATLPAGHYTIYPSDNGDGAVLQIEGEHHAAVFFGENAGRMAVDPNHSEVIFGKTGDHYTLSEIWDDSTHQGAQTIPSHKARHGEAQSAANAPSRVEVIASSAARN
jgi:hypothetical protein